MNKIIQSIINLLQKHWAPFVGIVILLILCTFNLKNQYLFDGDSARDTLQSLRLLRSRDITLIGPPLSLGMNGIKETYFSSLIYYIAAGMLLISNNSIFAVTFAMSLITASGIIPLYLILKKRGLNNKNSLLLIMMYVTNPVVVGMSRILWNPSPLIGSGLWGLYFLGRSAIIFGLIAGLTIYFHYFAIALIIFGIVFYVIKKKYSDALYALLSFTLTLVPFFLFELKNKFYLTTSLLYNLNQSPNNISFNQIYLRFLEIPSHLLGLFYIKGINYGQIAVIFGLLLWLLLIYFNRRNVYIIFFIISAIMTSIASHGYVGIQYILISIGVLVAYCINIKSKRATIIVILIVLFQAFNTFYIINSSPSVSSGMPFPVISDLEAINTSIKTLHNPNASFNITENVTGDARATYLRFFLERDRVSNLQDELHYEGLDELYVLTPSLSKTLQENKWEFTATPDLIKTHEITIDKYILLRFDHK